MRDALGGTVTLVIIVVFIVIALGYMAFNVNYTKAFRMKDKIISLYEDYEGKCDSECEKHIRDYARTLGYSTDNNLKCPDRLDDLGGTYRNVNGLYCVKAVEVVPDRASISSFSDIKGTFDPSDVKPKVYYKIVTKINLKIPIISNVFDFQFFYITGDTKSFEMK